MLAKDLLDDVNSVKVKLRISLKSIKEDQTFILAIHGQ
jgi:hypothetical protein